jgi:hypothetical protein
LVFVILNITCPSPFAAIVSTPGFCLVPSGLAHLGVPVNGAFALLIFILVSLCKLL